MRLQAFVFCDCYEQGRLKRPPPSPELVKVLPNGDITCNRNATPDQHDEFIAWRTHACPHTEGVVTGGELGYRLSLQVLHRALSAQGRSFPILMRKVLGCNPRTRSSHLTLKQVEKLQLELAHLKSFRCADRKIDRELRYLYGQMTQLVRAAMKFHKPIAL
jgi:hypothetical protein